MEISWLTKKTTYEDAIRENLVNGVEFGGCNDDWERLKAKMQPQDELWYFEPPSRRTMQIRGLALVRNGEIISKVVLAVG